MHSICPLGPDDPRQWDRTQPNLAVVHGPRPFDLDQRHNLNVAGSYVLGKWRLGGRIQYVSGTPYSPQLTDLQGAPVYPPYSVRIPDFFQLDIRADRIWKRCWGTIDLYFDIQNVTNRRNFANYNWNRRANTLEFSEQQGLFPLLGFEWRF